MSMVLKILKWTFAILVMLIVVMLAINWSDQPPSLAVLKMQSLLRENSSVPDVENAFIYAMGFGVPSGGDPVKAGVECVSRFNAAVHTPEIGFDVDFACGDSASSKYDSPVVSKILDTCSTVNRGCEVALLEGEQAIAQWLQDHDWMMQRYDGLLRRSKWRMTVEYSLYMPFPDYSAISNGRKMLMLKAWHLAGKGKVSEVRLLLDRDARFCRMVLSSSTTLLDKLVAASFLQKDFAFANLVLRRLQSKGITPAIPDAWLVPFGRDELSLAKAMAGELEFSSSILQETQVHGTLLKSDNDFFAPKESTVLDDLLEKAFGRFLLQQATQNERAEILARVVDMLQVPIEQFPRARQAADAYQDDLADMASLWHPYNPIGHALNVISGSVFYSDYAARMYDLEGARQAVLAVTQLREDGVGLDQIEVALGQSALRNPYDDAPFVWDAGMKSIVFKGQGQEDHNTYSFLY